MGAGCFAAAMAIRDCLVQEGLDGSVVFFGCPAEEGAGSKQFMARAGCFDGIDFALTWHPGTWNQVPAKRNVAIMGATLPLTAWRPMPVARPIWDARPWMQRS
ncbi:MAG: hypothetical protein ACLSHU_11710 [Oscillospiraceae bacterium]